MLAVRPGLGVSTLGEFIAVAKARPASITIGSAGIGTASHLTMELLKREAGIDVGHVPFRSSGEPILYVTDPKGMSRDTRRRSLDALSAQHLPLSA